MKGHTPGPWTAKHKHAQALLTDDEMGGLGWEIIGPDEPQLKGQFARAADAHLIAAAPDLLAACETALEWFDKVYPPDIFVGQAPDSDPGVKEVARSREMLRAAIENARRMARLLGRQDIKLTIPNRNN